MMRVLALSCLLATAILAQDTRTLVGTVKNRDGRPIAGAIVRVLDEKSGQVRSFITESGGSYHFTNLDSTHPYTVRASYRGQSSGTKRLSVFSSREMKEIDFTIDVSGD